MKRCRDCAVDKPLDQFWRNQSSPDGRAIYCIPCFSKRNRETAERRAARDGRTLRDRSARPSDVAPDEKYCPSCRRVLPLTSFVRNRGTRSGFGSYCRADEVLALLETQGSLCLICRRPIDAKTAHVDHDHVTGNVRGILCFRCNAGMGQFADSPEVLVRAARYLLTAAELRVPFEVVWTERLARVVEYDGSAS